MMKFPIYGKIKNVPSHQPVYLCVDLKKTCAERRTTTKGRVLPCPSQKSNSNCETFPD